MRIAYNKIGQTEGEIFDTAAPLVRIGSAPGNDIVLSSPFVAPCAALLSQTGANWELTPLGENDILVGEQALRSGERVLVGANQQIRIYPFSLTLQQEDRKARGPSRREALEDQMSRLILDMHRDLLARMDVSDADDSRRESEEYLLKLERDLEEIARLRGFLDDSSRDLVLHCAASTVQADLLARLIEGEINADAWGGQGRWTVLLTSLADFELELSGQVSRLQEVLELDELDDISQKIERLESNFWKAWDKLDARLPAQFAQYLGLRYLKKQIKDILFGYGPLEDLIRMPNISEIMVVSRDKIYVEKNGMLEKSGRRFVSDDVTISIIDRIVSRVGRRIDKSQPLVDARLLDGSRVNAVIDPLAISGPCITIRKFPARKLLVQDLIDKGSFTATVADFLRASVIAGCNILISGGTGTGKTTLLNVISDFIPSKERIVTIEDTAELQLQKDHVVRLETKTANVEGAGAYTIRDLVKNALRMRPDRVVVGECRGPEALDMLQAMNTGHDGSMTTIHANTSADVIQRLEVLVQQDPTTNLPVESIHRQVASAIDLVVQLTRMRDGRRCVSQVTEFVDYDESERKIRTKDIFRLEGEGREAKLCPTGSLPSFMGKLIAKKLIQVDSFYR